ncbi:hypothetical protein OJAV_G00232000 [Oryzias javanicus]|uniref:Protein phosphatase 1 regulatory subunit 14C n=1 Tax=Oryzias javanicus TaxID=123683 RepID=A0A3S2MBV8_ORYJA|nr:hypothetical protein OJAV_G00232000 [Oryzias javanicus]
MSAASTETSEGSRVLFKGAPGVGWMETGPINGGDPDPKKQGKVTVKYDRKELRKRLALEEWIIDHLIALYDCGEDELPDIDIDIDVLMEVNSEDERARIIQETLIDCNKPTDEFIRELLCKIRGMSKLSAPTKKGR